ncbi:MAG: hypothetical protein K8I29_01465 [Alphaproteobacteria bacterium]|uniref:Lipoprotein n=1 Tax=Candidatus Nitrobium versatile TaxID=2884831 RepID=A0A953J3G9_9BACT|nr:hypothetical protein [Candidatus Nitrobium versatile]
MNSSISFSSKVCAFFCAVLFFLSGCTTLEGDKGALYQPAGGMRIAVLPVENLTGKAAPLKEIRKVLMEELRARGIPLLDETVLENFLAQRRIRHMGGLDPIAASAFEQEVGVDAVLVTSLEWYDEYAPPKISLFSRLISTGDNPSVLWMTGLGAAGDARQGLLGLGLIEDPQRLQSHAVRSLVVSLERFLAGGKARTGRDGREDAPSPAGKENTGGERAAYGTGRFRPKISYYSPLPRSGRKYSIAVIPFSNESERKNAGEIMMLHFVRHLRSVRSFEVIEPGVVRQKLINMRVVMTAGLSLADSEVIFDLLGADLILAGKCTEYQDYAGSSGAPRVKYSVLLIEKQSLKTIGAFHSYNDGDEGVFLFDWKKVRTAHELASGMAGATVEGLSR